MKILLVDDDALVRSAVANFLVTALKHEVTECDSGTEALELFKVDSFFAVITDIRMPGMSGLDLLRQIKQSPQGQRTGVILVTGFSDLNSALFALREGAFDYLSKPVDVVELAKVLARLEETQTMEAGYGISADKHDKISETPSKSSLARMELEYNVYKYIDGIGKIGIFSDAMKSAVVLAAQFHDDRDIPVLIEGETGTGKEVIARLIHQGNDKAEKPFISVNCSALSPNLIETELFGYEGGAFTGAKSQGAVGKMELARGGTFLLDEIREMPLELQPKLLRAIQEREIFRVGGTKSRKLDIRIVSATNQNLKQLVKTGKFRKDLYFRLNLGRIYIPPLREQKVTIIPLSQMFLADIAKQKKRKFRFINKVAMKILEDYLWPGNIRELQNTIERIVLLYDEFELRPEHLDFLTMETPPFKSERGVMIKPGQILLPPDELDLLKLESEIVHKALSKFSNNKTRAAQYLAISRHSFQTRLNRSIK
ncbi:MAG: sigma-54-dependent Fis family transcriptional regulator [candidate division Zixibacteria bacterium]|nr:sigma-54-dependent Fis family transcriptional regulator [Candidatus Tariuqbacter arcticus]